jgi:hypothetical protein
MHTHEYVVCLNDELWEVCLDGRLLSAHPTRREALNVVDALAGAAALRGERSKILAGIMDGVGAVELPTIEPEAQPA